MKKKVLTVDDSRTMREKASFTLRGAGFDVVEATTEAGPRRLASHKVDLILADLDMPNIDGITLIRQVRAGDGHRTVPSYADQESDDAKNRKGALPGYRLDRQAVQSGKVIQVVQKVMG